MSLNSWRREEKQHPGRASNDIMFLYISS